MPSETISVRRQPAEKRRRQRGRAKCIPASLSSKNLPSSLSCSSHTYGIRATTPMPMWCRNLSGKNEKCYLPFREHRERVSPISIFVSVG
mmetsp:Transcript_35297/g.68251  ORF Transcript_35297/g.68251 Transcript_35297/m.68251 type:complete len:90 (-) Transcript_35297:12-281(-)